MAKAGGVLAPAGAPRWVNAFFGKAQILSAAYMGFAHGHNDAQKTMGIIALTIFGAQATGTLDNLPAWLAFLHPGDGGKDGDIDMWIVAHLRAGDGGRHRGGWLAHHQDPGPQDGEAASDPRLRRGNQLGHDPDPGRALRHAGLDHPQHLHRDHGRGLRQEPARAQVGVIERIIWAWILTIPAAGRRRLPAGGTADRRVGWA
jgi:PiT family inorganic phosphate transporter